MGANLFKTKYRSCIGEIALDELECLGVDYISTDCTTENVAPCGQDFPALLELYPVFDLSLSLKESGFLFEFQDRVLFIEDDGYSVSLRQANTEIINFVEAFNPENWTHICKLRLGTKYENRTLFDLATGYKPYSPQFFAKTWSDPELSWSAVEYNWSSFSYRKQFLYKAGERFRTISSCEETLCVYLVTKDLEVTDSTIQKYSSFISDPEHWVKVICIETGFNTCLGDKRKKHPFDLYEKVSLGCGCNQVELPIRYVPTKPLLNDLTYIKGDICKRENAQEQDQCVCPSIAGSPVLGEVLSISDTICTITSVVWMRDGVPIGSPPVAEFEGEPLSGNAPLTVQFTDLSTGGPTSWQWYFDGGSVVQSTIQNPVWIYESPGTYDVKLSVSNGNGQNVETKIAYVVVGEPPAPPISTKIIVIGNPYSSLGISDPTAVQINPDPNGWSGDIYGVQTVIYSPNVAESGPAIPGFIVKGGGFMTRDESVGDNEQQSYTDVRVYDLDGNFLRKNSYQGFIFNTYLYSYECPVQSIRTSDGKILSYLDSAGSFSQNKPNFCLCDLDGTNSSVVAYSSSLDIVGDMSLAPGSGSIYICAETNNAGMEVYKINNNLSPAWGYRYAAGSEYNNIYGFSTLWARRLCTTEVGGVEASFIGGTVRQTSTSISTMVLATIDDSGNVVSSWKYQNTSPWMSSIYGYPVDFVITKLAVDPVDGTIVATGRGACPALDLNQVNQKESVFVVRFDPTNGEVLAAKVVGFTPVRYYGLVSWFSPGVVADEDGSIYINFTPIFSVDSGFDPTNTGYGLCAVIKLNSSLEFVGGVNITTNTNGGHSSGSMSLSEEKVIVAAFMDEGEWVNGYSYPQDGAVVIIDKNNINANSAGDYWVEGLSGGPGFYVRNFSQTDVQMVNMELTKASISLTKSAVSISPTTPTITPSPKDPASVILN